eukprot:ANDGO_03336.mRNA.1 NADP-dependent malic enzyme
MSASTPTETPKSPVTPGGSSLYAASSARKNLSLFDPPVLRGIDVLNSRLYNKSTAFTMEERDRLGLRGLIPPRVATLETQVERAYASLQRCATPLDKYQFLHLLEDRNITLFYSLLGQHIEELMPIVYTPTVGEACLRYGHIFNRPRGLYISIEDKGHVAEILDNYPTDQVRAIVVTDGGRILGLGDLGCNGHPIPVGKLTLFTAVGGVHPATTLPITLDVGTDNKKLLADPLYPGLSRHREKGPEYYELVEEFVQAATKKFAHVLIQWEDVQSSSAFHLLEHYRDKILTFNDDIQGTAAVTLAGLLSAVRIKGTSMKDERVLFMGAGEAARGIADLVAEAIKQEGVPEEEAIKRCFLFDSKGLVVASRKHELQHHKLRFAHEGFPEIADWFEVVKTLKPTAIIGVSGQGGTFTEECVRYMAEINKRPVVFPLSNPTSCAECTAEQAFAWTDGRCLFASGSPFNKLSIKGNTVCPSQANNVYVFPGVAQGVLSAYAKHVTDEMFFVAAQTISSLVTGDEEKEGRLFPSIQRIREVSEIIAVKVATIAFDTNNATIPRPRSIERLVRDNMYFPSYPQLLN